MVCTCLLLCFALTYAFIGGSHLGIASQVVAFTLLWPA